MAVISELKKGGKTVATTTKSFKKGIIIPAKKTKAVAKNMKFETPTKLSPRMQHIHKMAQKYIVAQKKAAITRRSKAVKIIKMKDGRKVYVKKFGSQTARSLNNPNATLSKTRCARASRDHKAMLKVVKKYKLAHINKLREQNFKKLNKEGKFTPITSTKLRANALSKYNDKVAKTNIKLLKLKEDTNIHKIRLALGATSKNVQDIKINKEKNMAVLVTPTELAAKSVYANRIGKMRVGSMVLAKPAPKPAHTKKQAAHLAKVKELAKASREAKKEVTKTQHEQKVARQQAEKKFKQSRRKPKYLPTKVYRNRQTHQIFAVRRNKAVQDNRPVRGKMTGHRRMRAMVRVSRK